MVYYSILIYIPHETFKEESLKKLMEILTPIGVFLIIREPTPGDEVYRLEIEVKDNSNIDTIKEEIHKFYQNSKIKDTIKFDTPSTMMQYYQHRRKERNKYEN